MAGDGHAVRLRIWAPPGRPAAVIQILHGLGEHGGRYARFARAAQKANMVVAVHDHRGHGADSAHPGHFADKYGWSCLLTDARAVNRLVVERFPDVPLVLLGHSMGSFLAQHYAMQYGNELAGLLLSGATWPSRFEIVPAMAIAAFESWRLGLRGNSDLLHALGFAAFNKPFRPARTEYDWLSRDTAEVDRYSEDPLCGGAYSCALWRDLLGALFTLGGDSALEKIPVTLPILITGGTADPVGGDNGMTRLATHYAQTSHQRLTVKIYPGGRHEMLNEINRDEVMADWLAWIDATSRSAR